MTPILLRTRILFRQRADSGNDEVVRAVRELEMKVSPIVLYFPLILATTSFVGCWGNPHVTGRVTYPNGEPITTGHVVFTDDYLLAKSDIDRNGEYSLHMFSRNDGIRKGTYKVYISGAVQFNRDDLLNDDGDESSGLTRFELLVDPQYSNPDTSGWVFEIKKSVKIDLVVYPPDQVPEDQRTEAAKYMFDEEYRKKVDRVNNKPEVGNSRKTNPSGRKRLVNPNLL